jgi:hypothetical protein
MYIYGSYPSGATRDGLPATLHTTQDITGQCRDKNLFMRLGLCQGQSVAPRSLENRAQGQTGTVSQENRQVQSHMCSAKGQRDSWVIVGNVKTMYIQPAR